MRMQGQQKVYRQIFNCNAHIQNKSIVNIFVLELNIIFDLFIVFTFTE